MHNHTNHYSVDDDNVNIKTGGRKEAEEKGNDRQSLSLESGIVIVRMNDIERGRKSVYYILISYTEVSCKNSATRVPERRLCNILPAIFLQAWPVSTNDC